MILLQNMQSAIAQGILWGVLALGVYITYKLLDIADLTCEGSFALGGCVSTILIVKGCNSFLSLPIAFAAGMVAGLVTGILHTKLKIPAILSGILTMIALYSINIRVMGKANVSLLGETTIFTKIQDMTGLSQNNVSLLIGVILVLLLIGVLYWFFGTEIGCAIRATGNNEYMVRALGQNTDNTKIIGLVLSNGFIALSGALVAQNQGYADVKMGTGSIVIALASIVIGTVILSRIGHFFVVLSSTIIGSIIYRMVISFVLYWGIINTDDMKLFTAIIVALALGIPTIKKKYSFKRIPG